MLSAHVVGHWQVKVAKRTCATADVDLILASQVSSIMHLCFYLDPLPSFLIFCIGASVPSAYSSSYVTGFQYISAAAAILAAIQCSWPSKHVLVCPAANLQHRRTVARKEAIDVTRDAPSVMPCLGEHGTVYAPTKPCHDKLRGIDD